MSQLDLTVVGDGFVGKTTLLYRFKDKKLPDTYVPTVFENYVTTLVVDDKEHRIQLWDTAGQEDYDRLRILAYVRTSCCIVCFDISMNTTLDNVQELWGKEIRQNTKKMPIVLVGTKGDLRSSNENECIDKESILKIMKKIKATEYIECSAITGQNVQEVFVAAVRATTKKSSTCVIL